MAQGVQFEELRAHSIWDLTGSASERNQISAWQFLRWLPAIPLVLVMIFGSGSLALVQASPAPSDTRSRIAADYSPWEFTVIRPVDPGIVEEIQRDQELYPEVFEEPVHPELAPGSFWEPPAPAEPTPTPVQPASQTPTSTLALSLTAVASATPTLTATSSPTHSSTPTSTPFGLPSPIPPGVPPANTYWLNDDTTPLSHMMYATLANGNDQSSSSVSFYSPPFNSGQVLQAGTTTVNFYAWNPSPVAAVFSAELRSGGTPLGAGTFALPANTFDAYFFSASFSTGSHSFADGERLEAIFSLATPAEMYWDGAFNYSGVSVPSVATTPTPTASPTSSTSPTPTSTAAPTNTPTNTPVPPTNTPLPTATNTPLPTATNTPLPTATNTPTSTPIPTSTPTATPGTVTVNSGTCSIAGGSLSTGCTVSPSLSDTTKTFMVFQATSSDNTPNSSNVRCVLASTTGITCDRFGTTGTVNIQWQTVEFASGVTVEHLTPACNEDGDADEDITNVTITAVSDVSKTFLLFSHAQGGVIQDANDRRTVQLTGPTNVEIRQSGFGSCAPEGTASALQVVQFTNASVTRGLTGAMTGTSLSVGGLSSVNTAKTMLIYSYRTTNGGANIAAGLVRGSIDSPISLMFSRGDGTGQIDAIAWERIEFTDATTIQQVQPSMAPSVGTDNVSITAVDTARTIVFAGGQWTAGQGFGQASYTGDDVIGVAIGRHELTSSTNLLVTRDDTNGSAGWVSYVVEFAP